MLVMAFAPTVSKLAASEHSNASLVEVCTAEGMKWVAGSGVSQSDSDSQDEAPISAHNHGGECPYCSLQTSKFLTASPVSFASAQMASTLPSLFYQAPKPLFAWAQARSRAPPLSA
nr:hypothetical protein NCPCFENI_00929 [Cupriavidus sp.]